MQDANERLDVEDFLPTLQERLDALAIQHQRELLVAEYRIRRLERFLAAEQRKVLDLSHELDRKTPDDA